MGDLYEDIRDIELYLNKLIKETLKDIYKDDEDAWWVEGVPKDIRKECASRREDDTFKRLDSWGYLDFIHLKAILEKKWEILRVKFKKEIKNNKPIFISDLVKLNAIRNSVMHPSRNERITEGDFEFVRSFRKNLLPLKKEEFFEPTYIGTESKRFKDFDPSDAYNDDENNSLHLLE